MWKGSIGTSETCLMLDKCKIATKWNAKFINNKTRFELYVFEVILIAWKIMSEYINEGN